jgi:RNA polymerase sigma-70 factor (ECF subfamily)
MPCPIDLPDTLNDLTPDLMRLARHLTGQNDQAQDLCQETLFRLWRRREDADEIENLRAYARTILRNLYRQSLRDTVPMAELKETHITFSPPVFAVLALHDLTNAIDHLPATQARLIRLVAEGETSPQALAERTGLCVGTVMSRLARARAQLRADMGISAQAPVCSLY